MRVKKQDIMVFAGIYIFLFIVSIIFLTTPDYDFINYQAYNCYSLLNDRFAHDFFVGNSRTCLNPILYLPEYILMFKLNNHPYIFTLISVLDSVCLLFMVYKYALLIFKDNLNKIVLGITVFFILVYVAFSPVMMNLLDFSRGDCKIGFLSLVALYLLLKNIFLEDSSKRSLFIIIAGIFAGMAVALKYTAINYFISIFIIFVIYGIKGKIKKPVKALLLMLFSAAICFFVINAHWLYLCCKYYQNPVFPYFNHIFKSPYMDYCEDFLNMDYFHIAPRNIKEFLFYPLYKITYENIEIYDHFFGIEEYYWDPRYAINYFAIIAIICYSSFAFLKKIKNKLFENTNKDIAYSIILFTVFSFAINTAIFGTYRYIVACSILYGIILAIFVCAMFGNKFISKKSIVLLCFIYILITAFVYSTSNKGEPIVNYVNFNEEKFSMKKVTKVFEYEDLNIKDDSVVFLYGRLDSILAVNQNKKATYIGLPESMTEILGDDESYSDSSLFLDKISKILYSQQKIYIIFPFIYEENEDLVNIMNNISKKYNRKITNCTTPHIKFFNTYTLFDYTKCEFN